MAASSFFSLLLPVLLFLISTALTSMRGLNDDPLIQQVVSSDGHADLLISAEHQFSAFKKEYGKTYTTQEDDDYRFGVFMSNLRQARRNQIQDPTAIHGVTKFSDLTPSEFQNQVLCLTKNIQLPNNLKKAPKLPTDNLPGKYDWREDGFVTEVKDQGKCGACWAFASVATLETAHFLAHFGSNDDKPVELSEQQLIDCSDECTQDKKMCNRGCNFGHPILAYIYMQKVGGVEQAKDYPFIGTDTGPCKFDKNKIYASLDHFDAIEPDEDQYAANLVDYGTLSVLINGKMMQSYKGGVACPDQCPDDFTHAVTLVGYGSESSDRHWIIKNSWGKDYGENGYYRLCNGKLTCSKDPVAIVAFAA